MSNKAPKHIKLPPDVVLAVLNENKELRARIAELEDKIAGVGGLNDQNAELRQDVAELEGAIRSAHLSMRLWQTMAMASDHRDLAGYYELERWVEAMEKAREVLGDE